MWYALDPQSTWSSLPPIGGRGNHTPNPLAVSLVAFSPTQIGTGTNQPAYCPSRYLSLQGFYPFHQEYEFHRPQPLSCSLGASLSLALVTGASSSLGKGVNHLLSKLYGFPEDKESIDSHPVLCPSDWRGGTAMHGRVISVDSLSALREVSHPSLDVPFRVQGLNDFTCVVVCPETWFQVWESPAQYPATLL